MDPALVNPLLKDNAYNIQAWYKNLSENSGEVRIFNVCGEAAHIENAILLQFSDRY